MSELTQDIQQALAQASALAGRRGFAARVAAIEALESQVLERLQGMDVGAALPEQLRALLGEAAAQQGLWEAANVRLLRRLRQRLAAGRYTAAGLRRAFGRLAAELAEGEVYTSLDLLFAGLLGTQAPAPERLQREPGMVFYQPTPARHILQVVERAQLGPDDVFYDLGSGLGQVAIMVNLLSGARAHGIEYEPAYVEHAQRSALSVGASRVRFEQGDVRLARLDGGTVYFMYTPFRGAMLQQVLLRLKAEAATRPIKVATFGPCTPEIGDHAWLKAPEGVELVEDEVVVFRA